jgi:hypothetical protein
MPRPRVRLLRHRRPRAAGAAALAAALGTGSAVAAPERPASQRPAPGGTVPAADVQPARWVALGDSYTAGVTTATGAETGEDGCARTTGSYPELLRRELGAAVHLINVSCHGALVEHISRRAQQPAGGPLPPGRRAPVFPAVPPQAQAVSQGTEVVSVGAGAATLGLPDLLRRCAELGARTGNRGTPCRDAFDEGVPGRLAALEEEYDAMLWKVRQRGRYARLLTVGYPAVFPEDVTARCRYDDGLHFGTITFGDLAWARDSVLRPLNEVIARVSRAHGADHVDLYQGSVGHSVCDEEPWTDGLRSAGTDGAPGPWAYVQPNAAGHRYAAHQLTARYRSR